MIMTTTTTRRHVPGWQRQSRQASPELSSLCWPRVHSGAEDDDDDDDDGGGDDGDNDVDDFDDGDDDGLQKVAIVKHF